jgi:hypothetical protein
MGLLTLDIPMQVTTAIAITPIEILDVKGGWDMIELEKSDGLTLPRFGW